MRKLVQTLRQKAGGDKRMEGDVTHRVSVSAGEGWSKRNFGFLQRVALPAIFTPRRHTYSSRVFPTPAAGKLRLTWIGHASFLVQTERHNVLVDPNFAMWLGFLKRLRKPGSRSSGCRASIAVLITHAHFDHLNIRSLRAIGTDIPVVVPGGVAKLLRRRGFTEVHELDYWESFKPGGDLEIRLTPTQHWGARFLHDTHRRFGAYLIRQGARQVFHCGDSVPDGFTEIGERAGKIDVALMPIGRMKT
ncbi:MAG: MBL fold metallo-hydrolase [Verrucomicrobiales bacterium]